MVVLLLVGADELGGAAHPVAAADVDADAADVDPTGVGTFGKTIGDGGCGFPCALLLLLLLLLPLPLPLCACCICICICICICLCICMCICGGIPGERFVTG